MQYLGTDNCGNDLRHISVIAGYCDQVDIRHDLLLTFSCTSRLVLEPSGVRWMCVGAHVQTVQADPVCGVRLISVAEALHLSPDQTIRHCRKYSGLAALAIEEYAPLVRLLRHQSTILPLLVSTISDGASIAELPLGDSRLHGELVRLFVDCTTIVSDVCVLSYFCTSAAAIDLQHDAFILDVEPLQSSELSL